MTRGTLAALARASGLNERTVRDWLRARRSPSPSTERLLREACDRLGVRPPRKQRGPSNLYANFPDIRLRVSADERAAFLAAAEAAGLPLGVWLRNLGCRAAGVEPRITRNTGSGTTEQRGLPVGPRLRKNRPMACAVCGEPVDRDGAMQVARGTSRTARCMLHKLAGPEAER